MDSTAQYGPAVPAIRFYQEYISDLGYGDCRFEPSCSQYAIESVRERGLLLGSALTADRLVRCNGSAWKYYPKGRSGRLSDPAGGGAKVREKPVVPDWLLPPQPGSLPLRPAAKGDDGNIPVPLRSRLREYARFGDSLSESGDCVRAITEFKRVAFLGGTRELRFWSRVKAGYCFYRVGEWLPAADEFLAGITLAAGASERNALRLMVAVSHFNAGDYQGCGDILNQCEFTRSPRSHEAPAAGPGEGRSGDDPSAEGMLSQRWLLLNGFCSMATADWQVGAARFQRILDAYPGSPYRKRAGYLAQHALQGREIPSRSTMLAAVLSAVLPGSGQAYSGRYQDGVRHLLLNGILTYQIYRLVDHDNYSAAYLVAGIALPFYVGNIVGARTTAETFNQMERAGFVRRLIAGTEE